MEPLKCVLDCGQLHTRAELHHALRELLPLPSYYGENFDALYDCLTELSYPIQLEVRNLSQSGLGRVAEVLRRVLQDASRCNSKLSVSFTEIS